MVNPNNVVTIVNTSIKVKQKVVGILMSTPDECKFYFAEVSMGNSISSRTNKHAEHSRNYLYHYYNNTIKLSDVLVKAGAEIVDDIEKSDIDLSPEQLEKDTIINLIKGGE